MSHFLSTSWKAHLQECERLLEAPPTRLTWLRRAYARMYRFLLARYGDNASEMHPATTMPFVDDAGALHGKAPRSAGEIHTALQQIQAAQPQSLTADITPQSVEWITVLTRNVGVDVQHLISQIEEAGIPVHVRRRGREALLQVPFERRNDAFAFLATVPLPPRKAPRRVVGMMPKLEWRLLLFGFTVTCAVAETYLLGLLPPLSWLAVVTIVATLAAICGLALALAYRAFAERD